MIGIKGMKIPENAETCRFRHSIFNYCVIDKDRNTIKVDNNDKCLNCPLVDLGSEDMSWEELKGLAKDEIVFEHKEIGYFQIDSIFFSMQFFICGDIYFNDTKIFEDKKPFEMFQIINALTGEKK